MGTSVGGDATLEAKLDPKTAMIFRPVCRLISTFLDVQVD